MSSSRHSSQDDSPDAVDDEQLRIRIPNPKVYIQRQSLWVGRRGKPRCDSCRANNLKCDRVLPVCNHCSWGNNRACVYTPLPTPAHRGIPRCDRCRSKNIKCDRNLPVCNNCSEESDGVTCNYTPKRRNKRSNAQGGDDNNDDKPWLKIGSTSTMRVPIQTPDGRGHTFYGHNIASQSGSGAHDSPIVEVDTTHTGRFTAGFVRPACIPHSDNIHFGAIPTRVQVPSVEYVPHPINSAPQILINITHIEPWYHPSFAPLPAFISHRLRQVDPIEMPKREAFDMALSHFVGSLMQELQETACLSKEVYTNICRGLSIGDLSALSPRLQTWVVTHRMRALSDAKNLILVPNDSIFGKGEKESEELHQKAVSDALDGRFDIRTLEVQPFDRILVQNQIYDVLAYAHRSHSSAAQMMSDITSLRFASVTWPMAQTFVRLCPLCDSTRRTEEASHSRQESPATSS